MDTQDYIRLREVESRQFQRGEKVVNTVKHLIAACLYVLAIAVVFVVTVILYQFLWEGVFKQLILANIVKN